MDFERKFRLLRFHIRKIAHSLGIECGDELSCLHEIARIVKKCLSQSLKDSTNATSTSSLEVPEEKLSYLKLFTNPDVLERYWYRCRSLAEYEKRVLRAILRATRLNL